MKNKTFSFVGAILVGISLLMAGLTFSTMAGELTLSIKAEACFGQLSI